MVTTLVFILEILMAGPSNPSSSDPGPSNSPGGGNFSKILIIFGTIFEMISKVLEDLSQFFFF